MFEAELRFCSGAHFIGKGADWYKNILKDPDDEALAQATETYRLVRITRTAARTGPEGLGDLWWIWRLAILFLLPPALGSCTIQKQV